MTRETTSVLDPLPERKGERCNYLSRLGIMEVACTPLDETAPARRACPGDKSLPSSSEECYPLVHHQEAIARTRAHACGTIVVPGM